MDKEDLIKKELFEEQAEELQEIINELALNNRRLIERVKQEERKARALSLLLFIIFTISMYFLLDKLH
jgi:hypothetical protein